MLDCPKKCFFFLITLLLSLISIGQSPNAYFDAQNPNIKYLEHLIKKGIDEVRENHDLKSLINDSILYVAADDHTKYLKKFGRLSHYQSQDQDKRTPQNRAEFYGAKNYSVGENIAMVTYGSIIGTKTGEEISTKSYGGIAEALVTSWVNSPRHYKNIVTPQFEITGMSIIIDTEKNIIYACQKFAHVQLRFIFEENKAFFPYSNYTPPPLVNSFEGIPNELIKNYKYPYKLRHDKLEKCADCPDQETEAPDISLEYNYKGFVLRVENANYVNKLIRNPKDGFAVEIVDYEDYACGSPYYYEKPSRRNGQILLNGNILEPKYRKELFKGYKKREKLEEIRFFPYIFRKDSVSFFRRFGQYNTDKYISEYYEISLGKLPRNRPLLYNYNLIIIKDNQICDVIYFTQYCGDLYEEYFETDFIPYQFEDFKYGFTLNQDSISFSIPFQQGQYNFEKETILKNISSLSDYDFYIDSVKINAFSSIEGDSAINAQLQLKRGENIASIFQGIQDKEIHKNISTALNWSDFRKELRSTQSTRHLLQKRNHELLKEVNKNQNKYEPQLAPTRKGDVTVYFHVIPNLKSLDYYIKKEFKEINEEIKRSLRLRENYEHLLDQMNDLYRYTYSMVKLGHLSPCFFLALPLPSTINKHPGIVQRYLLFGIEFPDVFSQFPNWKADSAYYLDNYKKSTKIEFIPEFEYLIIKLISEDFMQSKTMNLEQYNALNNSAQKLKKHYESLAWMKTNLDKIKFNLNMIALNYFYKSNPDEQQENAIMSLSQVYEYYDQHDLLHDTLALKLAKMAVYYQNADLGVEFAYPYENEYDKAKAFVNEVGYMHPSSTNAFLYYEKLIADSKKMPSDVWCNMFIKPCGIPFQAFDYERLRNRFCEICVGDNNYLNELFY